MDGNYHIPFRSLYSANVNNMLMAGRDISATHVAFGTTRVMATCAVIGEAAGTGAALCAQKGVSPRGLYTNHLQELQQTLLRQDASIIGLSNSDENDLALRAGVKASSTLTRLAVEHTASIVALETDIGLLLPVDPAIDGLELLIDSSADTQLTVELWSTSRGENYVPHQLQTSASANVQRSGLQWVKLDLAWKPETARNAFLIIKANEAIALHFDNQPKTGVLAFWKGAKPIVSKDLEDHQPDQPVVQWNMRKFMRQTPCFRLAAPTAAFTPGKAIDGYLRPFAGPHLWSSDQIAPGQPEWLELQWDQPVQISSIHLTFNDDVNEDLINLHHHKTPFEAIPELVKDYRVEASVEGGGWHTVAEFSGNHKRKRVHVLSTAVTTDRIRVVIESTNGGSYAEIIEVRAYA
jgi:hypothetical protein